MRSAFAIYDPLQHDLMLDETYQVGTGGVPPLAADLLPPRPYSPEEIAMRLAVRYPQSRLYPGWIEFDAARADGRTPWRKRDRHQGLALHNNRLGGYGMVLGAGWGEGYRLVLLTSGNGLCYPLVRERSGRMVVFDDAAKAVNKMEEMLRTDVMPRRWFWAKAPEGVPPVVLVS